MLDTTDINNKINNIIVSIISRKLLNRYYKYNYIRKLCILKDHLETIKFSNTLKTLDLDSQYDFFYELYPPHHLKTEKDFLDVGFTKKQLRNKLMFRTSKKLKEIVVCTYTPGKIDIDCKDNCKDCN